jgi:trimethylamine-N-oxide reductase cytochrome c-type subunit TorC
MRKFLGSLFGGVGVIAGAALLATGAVAGVLFWGGFHWAMEVSNSNEFCISCHEMRDNVYVEYQKTVHYSNASGVQAGCADCHVPKPWLHKVARKIYATNELYHWAMGTIDTREKFEAHRAEMAKRVWATMEANDSRECRNCHAFETMAFDASVREGVGADEGRLGEGRDLHQLPQGHRARTPRPVDRLQGHVRRTRSARRQAGSRRRRRFTPSAPRTSTPRRTTWPDGGRPAGRLLPATALEVLGRDGDAVQVRVEGWQQDGNERVIYALMGRRIFSVALSPAATDLVERHETVLDEDTELTWHRVSADLWIAPGGVIDDQQKLWDYGAELNNAACSICHTMAKPGHHLANQWIGVLKAMERFSTLDKEQTRMLQKYLQFHASDVAGHGHGDEASLGADYAAENRDG